MQASAYDFVSALSAEELCPVCRELHAAVDECLCSSCMTHVCSDCSSLQPDTSWICTPCAAARPARAYPVATRPSALHVSQVLLSIREQTASLRQQLKPNVARLSHLGVDAGARARRTRHAAMLVARRWLAALLVAWAATRSWLGSQRVALQQQGQRAQHWAQHRARPRVRQAALKSRLVSQRALVELRRQSTRAWQALVSLVRTLPVRHHATSLLLATLILIAVARSPSGPETR
jgi:hypothetical protein